MEFYRVSLVFLGPQSQLGLLHLPAAAQANQLFIFRLLWFGLDLFHQSINNAWNLNVKTVHAKVHPVSKLKDIV